MQEMGESVDAGKASVGGNERTALGPLPSTQGEDLLPHSSFPLVLSGEGGGKREGSSRDLAISFVIHEFLSIGSDWALASEKRSEVLTFLNKIQPFSSKCSFYVDGLVIPKKEQKRKLTVLLVFFQVD